MNHNDVFNKIDELYSDYLGVWRDVCSIESPTKYKEGVDRVGDFFLNMAKARGWKTDVLLQSVAGNVIAITINENSNAAPIALSAHMDTVHPVGFFGNTPVKFDEEKIYGPGVTDCKGGAVACFLAMDALSKCGFTKRLVTLYLQPDEEVGSSISNKETINWICEKAKGSVAFLNTEGAHEGAIILSCKGILRYEITVHGVAKHSSSCTKASNAVAEAAYKIIELEKMKDADGITCNCGVIHGGTAPNSVADLCVFTADIRFSNNKEEMTAERKVMDIINNITVPGCSCEAKLLSRRPAMEYCQRNKELFKKINKINTKVGLPTLSESNFLGGSDAAYVTEAGIPCVEGMGVLGGEIHSINEYAFQNSLSDAAKRIAAIILYI